MSLRFTFSPVRRRLKKRKLNNAARSLSVTVGKATLGGVIFSFLVAVLVVQPSSSSAGADNASVGTDSLVSGLRARPKKRLPCHFFDAMVETHCV